MKSQPRQQKYYNKCIYMYIYIYIYIYILFNISRREGNQTMNLFQLIECNIRNISLEKSYTDV